MFVYRSKRGLSGASVKSAHYEKRFECEQCKQRFNVFDCRVKRDLSGSSVTRDSMFLIAG